MSLKFYTGTLEAIVSQNENTPNPIIVTSDPSWITIRQDDDIIYLDVECANDLIKAIRSTAKRLTK